MDRLAGPATRVLKHFPASFRHETGGAKIKSSRAFERNDFVAIGATAGGRLVVEDGGA